MFERSTFPSAMPRLQCFPEDNAHQVWELWFVGPLSVFVRTRNVWTVLRLWLLGLAVNSRAPYRNPFCPGYWENEASLGGFFFSFQLRTDSESNEGKYAILYIVDNVKNDMVWETACKLALQTAVNAHRSCLASSQLYFTSMKEINHDTRVRFLWILFLYACM